jgi:hypothetical protein
LSYPNKRLFVSVCRSMYVIVSVVYWPIRINVEFRFKIWICLTVPEERIFYAASPEG